MNSYQKLENMKREVISKFNKDELKQYIYQLTNRYYASFINNDVTSHNITIRELDNVISIFENVYPNIRSYINYSLLKSANNLFQMSFQRNISLIYINEVDIDVDELSRKSLVYTDEEMKIIQNIGNNDDFLDEL